MKQVSLMIKPASSLCNLRCKYCFYSDITALREVESYGIMHKEIAASVIENAFCGLADGDRALIAFQGGEPTLAGLAFFENFITLVKRQPLKISVDYALQTNGINLNEAWCDFLRNNNFLVGLSLDGYAENHNQYRVDPKGKGTYARVMATKQLLDQKRVPYNVLCTLTNPLARHPQKVWRFLLKENIRFVQFTPCLGGLRQTQTPWALTPQRFHSFYTGLFPLWRDELQKGNYISVKLFDDIVNLFVRRQVTSCGLHGRCQLQHIVEADGSLYPCDFYVLDQYKGGNLAEMSLAQADSLLHNTGFIDSRKALPTACETCRYRNICAGGCKRMENVYVSESGFCGYRQLLDDIGEELCRIGDELIRLRSPMV